MERTTEEKKNHIPWIVLLIFGTTAAILITVLTGFPDHFFEKNLVVIARGDNIPLTVKLLNDSSITHCPNEFIPAQCGTVIIHDSTNYVKLGHGKSGLAHFCFWNISSYGCGGSQRRGKLYVEKHLGSQTKTRQGSNAAVYEFQLDPLRQPTFAPWTHTLTTVSGVDNLLIDGIHDKKSFENRHGLSKINCDLDLSNLGSDLLTINCIINTDFIH